MTTKTGNELLLTGSNNYVLANELALINQVLTIGVDQIQNASPGSPADNDSRLILATPTGDFVGHENEIAIYNDGTWHFAQPFVGLRIWVRSLKTFYIYSGDESPNAWIESNAWFVLTDSAGISVDAAKGPNFSVTLGGNRTLNNPSNINGSFIDNDGVLFRFRVVQDGTGSRTLSYQSKYLFPGGTPPTLSTGAGAVDLLEFIFHEPSDRLLYRGSQLNLS